MKRQKKKQKHQKQQNNNGLQYEQNRKSRFSGPPLLLSPQHLDCNCNSIDRFFCTVLLIIRFFFVRLNSLFDGICDGRMKEMSLSI